MTEIKKGDRIKVSFEGVVETFMDGDLVTSRVKADSGCNHLLYLKDKFSVTKLETRPEARDGDVWLPSESYVPVAVNGDYVRVGAARHTVDGFLRMFPEARLIMRREDYASKGD